MTVEERRDVVVAAAEPPVMLAPGRGAAVALPGIGGALAARPGSARPPGPAARLAGTFRAWLGPLVFVVAPTLAAAAYFGFVAADRYVAEAQFVVRSADRAVASGLGALLQSTGLAQSQDDAFIVHAFIDSRAALRRLEDDLGFGARMGVAEDDPIARWPNLLDGGSFEGLFDYYRRRVTVNADVTTGVSTLRVEAFTPADAQEVAAALLRYGEDLINGLNSRALADALASADSEVALAEARMAENQAALAALRRSEGLVDPLADTETQIQLVAALALELARKEAERRRIASGAPGSPQLRALDAETAALRRQIEAERAKLVGSEPGLADVYAAFETLALERGFAEEALTAARAAREQARAEALRKQRYLEVVVPPMAPDYAREPRRLLSSLAVFGASFMLYAMLWLLYVNAREHRG